MYALDLAFFRVIGSGISPNGSRVAIVDRNYLQIIHVLLSDAV
jgi:hypothetical protein